MRQIAFVLLLGSAVWAQSVANQAATQTSALPARSMVMQAAPQQPSGAGDERRARMRDDLNKLESLNLNMSSEIEFLRDQNLQILLRTNVQMWTILLRDLRQQIEDEERRGVAPAQSPPTAKPHQ